MRRVLKSGGLVLALAGALVLAGCKAKEENPEPQPTATDGPRSIFQGDADKQVLPDTQLAPLEMTLSFADGTAELTEAVRAELATIVESPQVAAGGPIVLRGHSDVSGEGATDLESSRERAEAVRDFLREAGIAEERIEVIAFGGQNPLEPNALPDGSPNEEGRAANRRVEVTVETGRSAKRQQTLVETLTTPEAGETRAPGSAASTSASEQ
ncbi:OmpA family protein [Qipengyuania sp. 1NDH17]|uniref:OmpA family protein n=1 Tax=Qipengyuania polymorpha TaxID=2867234 RepID=A0ABS7IZ48_9SPHN|nr:OmpA family protein [Qipengyuania polymorpha]MBX7458841.1 OmpA family protein [Qipengyuania polymorpha]